MAAETVLDLRSGPGLRLGLARIAVEGGWSGPTGRRLLGVLGEHCARIAPLVERRTGQPADAHRADDLMSRAWEILVTRPSLACAADNPWGYLTRCLLTAGVNAAVAERLLVRDVAVQGGGVPVTVSLHRVGQEVDALDRYAVSIEAPINVEQLTARWDAGLVQLHEDLVAAGAPERVTAAALDRVVDLVATHRNGYREGAAKRDRVLAHLGLSPGQSSALVTLVAGTRRGGPSESLWVQHRERRASADSEVSPGVRARIAAYVAGFGADVKVPA